PPAHFLVAFALGLGYERAERARRFGRRRLPVKTVPLAGGRGEVPGVFEQAVLVGIARVVLPLCVHVGEADLRGAELISADTPVEYLLLAARGVGAPASAVLHEGNRRGPVAGPYRGGGRRVTRAA